MPFLSERHLQEWFIMTILAQQVEVVFTEEPWFEIIERGRQRQERPSPLQVSRQVTCEVRGPGPAGAWAACPGAGVLCNPRGVAYEDVFSEAIS